MNWVGWEMGFSCFIYLATFGGHHLVLAGGTSSSSSFVVRFFRSCLAFDPAGMPFYFLAQEKSCGKPRVFASAAYT